MEWEHKGITFKITVEPLGPFFLASAEVEREGPYVRIRPFSALEGTKEEALENLKRQIRLEYRKVPDLPSTKEAVQDSG